MGKFNVQWDKIQSKSSIVGSCGKSLEGMTVQVSSVKNNLNCMGRYTNVMNALNSLSNELHNEARTANLLGTKLQEVSILYKNTEQQIVAQWTGIEKPSEKFNWKQDNLIWNSIAKSGVIGTVVAAFGKMVTGGVDYRTLLGGANKFVTVLGDIAKNAYKDKPDYKKLLFGDWEKGGALRTLADWAKKNKTTITSKKDIFTASISKQVSEYGFKGCQNVGDKIKVGTKWAGMALSGVMNGISNYEEYKTTGISAERAVAETITETLVDVGIGIVATAGATALLGASAPAVLVGATAVAATWALDAGTRALTKKYLNQEKGLTELVSDTYLDFKEFRYKCVKNAVQNGVKWCKSLC